VQQVAERQRPERVAGERDAVVAERAEKSAWAEQATTYEAGPEEGLQQRRRYKDQRGDRDQREEARPVDPECGVEQVADREGAELRSAIHRLLQRCRHVFGVIIAMEMASGQVGSTALAPPLPSPM